MINHARTLLLNISGAAPTGVAGDEYVPARFQPIALPRYLQTLRAVLFGSGPDRFFLNFRARELLYGLHTTELEEYVYALDPRVTYWPEQDAPFFGPAAKISIDAGPNNSAGSQLAIVGTDKADVGSGKSEREYAIDVASGAVTVKLLSADESVTTPLEMTSGSSQLLSFPRSSLSFRAVGPADGDSWRVTTVVRPDPVVSTLLPVLELLGEPLFLELFGVEDKEPYATFKRLWFDHPNPVYRLNGLVLGLIYRTNELSRTKNG